MTSFPVMCWIKNEMRLSKNAKLFWDDQEDYDDPNWTEITKVQDLTLTESYEEANVTDRDSGGYTMTEPTLNGIELSFTLEINNDDFDTFFGYYISRSKILLKVVDSDDDTDEDHTGLLGWFKIFSLSRDQNLGDSQKINIVMKPCVAPIDEPMVYLPLPEEESSVSD